MFYELHEENILREKGSEMFARFFGERSEKGNQGVEAKLLPPIPEAELKLAETGTRALKSEIQQSNTDNNESNGEFIK